MTPELNDVFCRIKPLCDELISSPNQESVLRIMETINSLNNETLQDLQLYILFPIVTHLKNKNLIKKELQCCLVDAMRIVLEKCIINLPEMFNKYQNCILNLIIDNSQPGMVANVSEELKLSVIQCLTTLMLQVENKIRLQLFQKQVPMLAQTIFISVQIAKLEKLRILRISAISCVLAYTATHDSFLDHTNQLIDSQLEAAVVDMLSSILPGVLGALQDVATCKENPGHGVVVRALTAIHRIICLVMNDKYLDDKTISTEDFAKLYLEKTKSIKSNSKEKSSKNLIRRSQEWFEMVGEKLQIVVGSVISLQMHEHYKVRMELAMLCSRILLECNRSMKPSLPYALNVIIALSNDEHPLVSAHCLKILSNTVDNTNLSIRDVVSDSFTSLLVTLPRILNNIDNNRKLSSLNLLYGYLKILCDNARPQQLTSVLTLHDTLEHFCMSFIEACSIDTSLSVMVQVSVRDLESTHVQSSPWAKLKHIDESMCKSRMGDICRLLGEAECSDLLLDRLLDLLTDQCRNEAVFIINHMGSAPGADPRMIKRIVNTYIEADVWYSPLEVGAAVAMDSDTLDVTVYDPNAWSKDSVPGLFEGAVETRYTDITYQSPRIVVSNTNYSKTLSEAQSNLAFCCLLTEGVGMMAKRLGGEFQEFLLKTLCLVLERVGSKYELLHLAGVKAINDITVASGCTSVGQLIGENADYFTYQVTTKLKKAWNSKSALEILQVVMEYSDVAILDCLHGIVSDVLIYSCDKYHGHDLTAYLQVFLCFVKCIRKWFPYTKNHVEAIDSPLDLFSDTLEYIKEENDTQKLLEVESEIGKSAEEMFKEDQERDDLDYDDRVADEKQPPPRHIEMTVTILKRSLNFIPSCKQDEKLLSLQILNEGLVSIRGYDDEVLPLVHLIWGPLVGRFLEKSPIVLRRSLELLVTMADVSKDFIRSRTIKEVIPNLYKFLRESSHNSYLKDKGSEYRTSQAYKLQLASLSALPNLVVDLCLEDNHIEDALSSVDMYLSNKQPLALQDLAVNFFIKLLQYDEGAVWHHLRKLCDNKKPLNAPENSVIELCDVIGTPHTTDNCKKSNIERIFVR